MTSTARSSPGFAAKPVIGVSSLPEPEGAPHLEPAQPTSVRAAVTTLAERDKGGLRPETPKSRAGRRTVAFPRRAGAGTALAPRTASPSLVPEASSSLDPRADACADRTSARTGTRPGIKRAGDGNRTRMTSWKASDHRPLTSGPSGQARAAVPVSNREPPWLTTLTGTQRARPSQGMSRCAARSVGEPPPTARSSQHDEVRHVTLFPCLRFSRR
jgi:hypothetical protein